MITRIVKLQFQPEKLEAFLAHFETIKWQVAQYPRCLGMQLLQDQENPCIIFTYSRWEDETALNAYRDSELFGKVWPAIKPWFEKRAEAWTVAERFDGFPVK